MMPWLKFLLISRVNFSDLKSRKLKGVIVSPSEPRNDTGVYWGYTVRIAKSLSDVFLKSPYDNGYDLTIGTSDKGEIVHDVTAHSLAYNHVLIVYGGLQGLESALETDDKLDAEDPSLLFDHYLNTVPCQGLSSTHYSTKRNDDRWRSGQPTLPSVIISLITS